MGFAKTSVEDSLKYQEWIKKTFSEIPNNKLIYRERFVTIVELNSVEITQDGFKANITSKHLIKRSNPNFNRIRRETWNFGSIWGGILGKETNCFSGHYAGWTIWTKPDLTRLGVVCSGAWV